MVTADLFKSISVEYTFIDIRSRCECIADSCSNSFAHYVVQEALVDVQHMRIT